ncbi:TPA: ead/Ea22-like family protein [Klebsiella pneumoniae]
MTDITELAQSLKAAAEKATPGEWWADEVKNEGCYGSGDDCVEGFTSYAIYGSDGQTLFDSLNSDAACISEEYDGEGRVAWDETAQRNAEFIALANPANVLALVEALEKAQAKIIELQRKYEIDPRTHEIIDLEERVAELDSEVEKWKQEAEAWGQVAEKQLAMAIELESRNVKLVDCDFGAVQHMSGGSTDYCHGFVDGTQNAIRAITAAGIKVEAE